MGLRLPDHCCCCDLRPGSVVIGGFVLAVCFPLMSLLGMRSAELKKQYPATGTEVKDAYFMVIYMYWLSAALNAIEALMTFALFYGIYYRKERWVTRWLFVTVGWWTQHSVLSMAILLSTSPSRIQDLLFASFIGPFLFFLGYRCVKTVAGLRSEMILDEEKAEKDLENQRAAASNTAIDGATVAVDNDTLAVDGATVSILSTIAITSTSTFDRADE